MIRPILNIVDEKVVLTLTVQDNAAKAAAASAAAAAASEVETGLDAVATGEDRVATGLDRIATAADRVQTGLDAIATNADRTQTGLDAIATAADRVQTGLDRIATGEDRVQTGLDRIATGEDATLSQAWAESPTEPAGVGTKSSLTSANESKAARDEIVAKVDFTGAAENDLLQANGAGVFEAKSPTLVNKSAVPFRASPFLPPIGSWQSLRSWDNFSTNGALVTSDSGATYANLVGNGFTVTNGKASTNTNLNITGLPCSANGFICQVTKTFSGVSKFYIWKDVDNYYVINQPSGTGVITIDKVVAGVTTNILTATANANAASLYLNESTYIFGYFSGFATSARRRLIYNIKELGIFLQVNVETDEAVFDGFLTHAGFETRVSPNAFLTSIYLSNNKANDI